MSFHRVALTGLLLAALAAPTLTAETRSAQEPDPTAAPSTTPAPSATPGVSASPATPASDGTGETATLCDDATMASVIDYMGGGTPLSVSAREPSGTLLEGCEVILSNGSSIIVAIHDASDWEGFIASLDFEPVEGVEGMYYSDIVGLVWRPAGADLYASLRLPLRELIDHRQVLSLLLADEG
jgi:hypothetical protein